MHSLQRDLPDQIPDPSKLTLSRLHQGGWLMTDTCNTAQKFKWLLFDVIAVAAREKGVSENHFLCLSDGLLASSKQCLDRCSYEVENIFWNSGKPHKGAKNNY